MEQQVCEKGQSAPHVSLHVRQFGKVNHVLQYLAHDHDLALDCLQWSGFATLLG